MKKGASRNAESPSTGIDARIAGSPDWRREMLSRIRRLIEEADPEAVEERKWRKPSKPAGVPVWYHDGIICHTEAFKDHVRLTFLKGASLKDPKGLFNSGLKAMLCGRSSSIKETESTTRASSPLSAPQQP